MVGGEGRATWGPKLRASTLPLPLPRGNRTGGHSSFVSPSFSKYTFAAARTLSKVCLSGSLRGRQWQMGKCEKVICLRSHTVLHAQNTPGVAASWGSWDVHFMARSWDWNLAFGTEWTGCLRDEGSYPPLQKPPLTPNKLIYVLLKNVGSRQMHLYSL